MHVAILGAGGVGACAALELAAAGCTADVFERQGEPLRGASYVNEGKIHQGFMYANDDPDRTARTMAVGALTFRRLLARWIDVDRAFALSTPFVYAVLDDSMLGVERIRAHFDTCLGIFGGLQQATGFDYLGSDEPPGYRELSRAETAETAAAERILAAFETTERCVDPRPLADALVAALAQADGITLVVNAEVQRVARRGDGRFMVTYADPEPRVAGPYDQVINALWESRLAVAGPMRPSQADDGKRIRVARQGVGDRRRPAARRLFRDARGKLDAGCGTRRPHGREARPRGSSRSAQAGWLCHLPTGRLDLLVRAALAAADEARAAWLARRAVADLDVAPWNEVRMLGVIAGRIAELEPDASIQPRVPSPEHALLVAIAHGLRSNDSAPPGRTTPAPGPASAV